MFPSIAAMSLKQTEYSPLPSGLDWHTQSSDIIFSYLRTFPIGLSGEEASSRLSRVGSNELIEEQGVSPLKLLLEQFTSLLIIILIAAAVISAMIGEPVEAIAIIIIVILAGVLGFVQEYQAGKAIESLKKMAAPNATALRDNKETLIPTRDLVPGDIVLLKTGDRIPADARLLEVSNLKIDEASLTGESESVEKISVSLPAGETTIGDRKNMVYMGTSIAYGRGRAVVVATGMKTEFGKIAALLQSTESRKTPLQNDLDKLGKILGIFSIVLAAVISLFGIFRGYSIVEMFVWGVALAVAVIPEALPAVVTISLALGVRRMVKRRALVRKLPAVETLGATTIICSDKTGTLTQDEMTVRKIYVNGKMYDVDGVGYTPVGEFFLNGKPVKPQFDRDLGNLLYAGVLCSDTVLRPTDGGWEILGDPTEGGIIVAAAKAGINQYDIVLLSPRVNELPFSSERKRMTTIHRLNYGMHAFSKGAPEIILASCSSVYRNGKAVPLDDSERTTILNNAYTMGESALRVIALSDKPFREGSPVDESVEKDMVFLGLVGMIDPPRPEVKDAIRLCEKAGIKPVMITGDHKITAVAVARELGILKNGGVMTGVELEHVSDEVLEQSVESIDVFARIAPEHKMRIVTAFMNRGHVVAMTGDGVNDAPSLKKADIGVAMGITGTDVSKEAADMILTDDNFASIVSAVEEGRSIFENIRKYLIFLLSGNMATVFAMIIALIGGLPLPLDAVQILFINFIMDGVIAIALGVEPPEPGNMLKKPRNVKEGILTVRAMLIIAGIGVMIALVTLGVFIWALSSGYSHAQAMTLFFITLILSRLFNGFNCRSMEDSIFKLGVFSNKPLVYSTLVALSMTIAVLVMPILQEPFRVVLLHQKEWLIAIAASAIILLSAEIQKALYRKMRRAKI